MSGDFLVKRLIPFKLKLFPATLISCASLCVLNLYHLHNELCLGSRHFLAVLACFRIAINSIPQCPIAVPLRSVLRSFLASCHSY